jgi:hypothetical protein
LTADVFNFTNLLNKNWGKRYFASFGQVQLLEQRILADKTTPTFSFDLIMLIESIKLMI